MQIRSYKLHHDIADLDTHAQRQGPRRIKGFSINQSAVRRTKVFYVPNSTKIEDTGMQLRHSCIIDDNSAPGGATDRGLRFKHESGAAAYRWRHHDESGNCAYVHESRWGVGQDLSDRGGDRHMGIGNRGRRHLGTELDNDSPDHTEEGQVDECKQTDSKDVEQLVGHVSRP